MLYIVFGNINKRVCDFSRTDGQTIVLAIYQFDLKRTEDDFELRSFAGERLRRSADRRREKAGRRESRSNCCCAKQVNVYDLSFDGVVQFEIIGELVVPQNVGELDRLQEDADQLRDERLRATTFGLRNVADFEIQYVHSVQQLLNRVRSVRQFVCFMIRPQNGRLKHFH